jgi:hypothetical protein
MDPGRGEQFRHPEALTLRQGRGDHERGDRDRREATPADDFGCRSSQARFPDRKGTPLFDPQLTEEKALSILEHRA